MQNFGSNPQKISRTSILTELSNGISELGEAFAVILNDMVVQSGITNPKAEIFDVVPESWRKLAGKPDKTPLDIEKLDEEFKSSVQILAESYLLFIARETENSTGKIEYLQYEKFLMKYRFGHYDVMNRPEYIQKVKLQIKNAFNKLASHGESSGDNLIDKKDMAAFIYAISTKSKRDSNNKFLGFEINGLIKPEDYAANEHDLFEPDDNLFSVKLRVAYKILNN
ncbi:hypothetical protein HDR58_09175 [bacterium]|nr:hypothetical protein [bacterium]